MNEKYVSVYVDPILSQPNVVSTVYWIQCTVVTFLSFPFLSMPPRSVLAPVFLIIDACGGHDP